MSLRAHLRHNAWWGKLLGAGLGFIMAGPPGALFGIVIGNFFDRGLSEHFSRPHSTYHTEKRLAVRQTFQHATFLVMGHLCKVDGRVSEEDILFAKKIMQELHLNRAERASAQYFFTQGKAANFKIDEPLRLLKNLALNNPRLVREFVQLQYRTAQISGLTPKKIAILNHLLTALNLAPLHEQAHAQDQFHARFNQQYQQYNHAHTADEAPSIESAYTLLGIPQNATKKDVKHAYRKKVSLYHPDKYIAKGHSEADIKKANEKTQSIRKAYESICEQEGW
ncbi:MAG: co-chaperone DjlA [Legionella sp.]|nr:co-chaperone DjlA [Legionella sp.]